MKVDKIDQINMKVVWGLISVAILGGISLAAKEAISNLWAGLSFRLNRNLRKGMILEVKIQGELLQGILKEFSLSRMLIEGPDGSKHLILISDLKNATIKILGKEKEAA